MTARAWQPCHGRPQARQTVALLPGGVEIRRIGKATVKSLEFPEMTVQVVGNTAIVRHLWVSQTELEGKVTDTKIGVIQVWQKQDGGWKLLARASYRLPQQA